MILKNTNNYFSRNRSRRKSDWFILGQKSNTLRAIGRRSYGTMLPRRRYHCQLITNRNCINDPYSVRSSKVFWKTQSNNNKLLFQWQMQSKTRKIWQTLKFTDYILKFQNINGDQMLSLKIGLIPHRHFNNL